MIRSLHGAILCAALGWQAPGGWAQEPPARGRAPIEAPTEASLLAHWRAHPLRPAEYVVETFRRGKRWVVLGEMHRVRHDVELVRELIPKLHRITEVRCLALEFLTAEGTEEANRLVTAPTFDRARALAFFRHQNPEWNYAEYFGLLESVWRSNRESGAARGPFLLQGLRREVDFERLHYGDEASRRVEQARLDHYDLDMAEQLEAHVLRLGRPALIYVGIAHATAKFTEYWLGTDRPLPRMGNLVYREPYTEAMWIVALHAPFFDAASRRSIYPFNGTLDRVMAAYRQDIGFDLPGSPFEGLRDRHPAPYSQTAHAFGELFDGYIIHRTPILAYGGVTCIPDWIPDEAEYRWYGRHLPSLEASRALDSLPFSEYRAHACDPSADHGEGFARRFKALGIP